MKLPKFDIHDKKTQVGLAGAGGVVALALYRKHAAAAASSGTGVTDPVAAQALDASTIENGIVGDLQPQIDNLAAQLAGLKPSSPTPASPTAKPRTPAQVIAALRSTPWGSGSPVPATNPRPAINAAAYPVNISANGLPGDPLVTLGIIGPGAIFTGHNVGGGAPVYAIVGNQAVQGFNPSTLPAGTRLATLQKFQSYIAPATTKGKL